MDQLPGTTRYSKTWCRQSRRRYRSRSRGLRHENKPCGGRPEPPLGCDYRAPIKEPRLTLLVWPSHQIEQQIQTSLLPAGEGEKLSAFEPLQPEPGFQPQPEQDTRA